MAITHENLFEINTIEDLINVRLTEQLAESVVVRQVSVVTNLVEEMDNPTDIMTATNNISNEQIKSDAVQYMRDTLLQLAYDLEIRILAMGLNVGVQIHPIQVDVHATIDGQQI